MEQSIYLKMSMVPAVICLTAIHIRVQSIFVLYASAIFCLFAGMPEVSTIEQAHTHTLFSLSLYINIRSLCVQPISCQTVPVTVTPSVQLNGFLQRQNFLCFRQQQIDPCRLAAITEVHDFDVRTPKFCKKLVHFI